MVTRRLTSSICPILHDLIVSSGEPKMNCFHETMITCKSHTTLTQAAFALCCNYDWTQLLGLLNLSSLSVFPTHLEMKRTVIAAPMTSVQLCFSTSLCKMARSAVIFLYCCALAVLLITFLLIFPPGNCENAAKQRPPYTKQLDGNKTQDRVKILLLAYGRTGSSLAGELLSLDDNTAYFFEPFYK